MALRDAWPKSIWISSPTSCPAICSTRNTEPGPTALASLPKAPMPTGSPRRMPASTSPTTTSTSSGRSTTGSASGSMTSSPLATCLPARSWSTTCPSITTTPLQTVSFRSTRATTEPATRRCWNASRPRACLPASPATAPFRQASTRSPMRIARSPLTMNPPTRQESSSLWRGTETTCSPNSCTPAPRWPRLTRSSTR